jgi:uncharacterized protein (DUF1697 family)
LRTKKELSALVAHAELIENAISDDRHFYIALLSAKPTQSPALPLRTTKQDVELIKLHELDVLCFAFRVNGSYGFPNAFVEKTFGVPATTRNLNTLRKAIQK